MAISCDSSGDEYYMTNRVFDFTSGSAGKKTVGYGGAHLFLLFKKERR